MASRAGPAIRKCLVSTVSRALRGVLAHGDLYQTRFQMKMTPCSCERSMKKLSSRNAGLDATEARLRHVEKGFRVLWLRLEHMKGTAGARGVSRVSAEERLTQDTGIRVMPLGHGAQLTCSRPSFGWLCPACQQAPTNAPPP